MNIKRGKENKKEKRRLLHGNLQVLHTLKDWVSPTRSGGIYNMNGDSDTWIIQEEPWIIVGSKIRKI